MYIVVIRKKTLITKALMEVTGSKSTYQYITDNPITIIQKHIKYMKNINLAVSSNMEELPCLYWLPKLHKTPFWLKVYCCLG